MAILGNPILLSGGGGAKLNIFSGTTQPKENNGIWIKSEQEITNIVQDNDVWAPNTFYNPNVNIANSFFVNSSNTNRVFYYNGYMYKFQSNTNGKGLFKAPIDTAVFTQVISTTIIPHYGLAQDPSNPRYLYGLTMDSSNNLYMHKYDLASATDTVISGNMNYYGWTYSCQSAAIYNGHFYGFLDNSSSQGSTPYILFEYNLNNGGVDYTELFDVEDAGIAYPRLEAIGSNLYMLYLTNKVLTVRKFDLTNKTSSIMSLSGNTNVGVNYLDSMIYTTDNANKIFFMSPYGDTNGTSMFVLNVDTGVVSSYPLASGVVGVKSKYAGMMYYNGIVYIYGMCISSSYSYEIYQFKLTGKSYPTGTLAMVRTSNNSGVFETELMSPKDRFSGTYNMFKTGYNMVYQSIDGQLVATHPVYNGDGSSWVQIR